MMKNTFFLSVLFVLIIFNQSVQAEFVAFESGQVRPIAQSPDGSKLFVVNTPDNRLEIFDANNGSPVHVESVTVGLEPVSVAAYTDDQVWVVNYLSDSISIIDVSISPARVIKTLLVGDEPADIVFAGENGNRAFITAAHRGQNSPYNDPSNPGELIIPGIGRADVWVFDATDTGDSLGGNPLTILTLFGDTPKALAVSPNGDTVYAAIFKSGNQTTVLHEEVVCDDGDIIPCQSDTNEQLSVGKLPPPTNKTISGVPQPEVGLIVKFDGSQWIDELSRDWTNMVRFNLPDKDVFAIDANAETPVELYSYANVGTVLFNMAVNPVSGRIYVANTEAVNEVRFEGPGTTSSTVQGHLHEARITVIDPPGSVTPIHLNKHIDYSVSPMIGGSEHSLAIPKGMAVTADGNKLYVVAKGSRKVGVFDTAALENNSFTPSDSDHIFLSAGGPDGLLLDEVNNRLYVTTRFDNALSVIDTVSDTEIGHIGLHNPEPPSVIAGRQFLYDATQTSSNGEASCASCHVEGDKDELAWDLGDPDGGVIDNQNPFTVGPFGNADFHPMKGPMTTQTFRGMDNHGPMHWRGDRSGANVGGDALDEDLAFKEFNAAFEGLLGNYGPLQPAQMQAFTDFVLQITPPPNPIRALDNSLTPDQQAGRDYYMGPFLSDSVLNCNGCHELNPGLGFFGTNGTSSFEGETQHLKIPQLRNMYEKVGMFGMADVPFFANGDNGHKGDQIRGFGFTHDGSVDTLERFHDAVLFNFSLSGADPDVLRKQMVQFMFAFDSNLKPVVGQQITNSGPGPGQVDIESRLNLLILRALAYDAELIVKVNIAGEQRGAHMQTDGSFKTDKAADAPWSAQDLINIAQISGQEVTYTAVPLWSGERLGIDRDEDGVLDSDDNCPAFSNSFQMDTDMDGIGDACEPPDFDGDNIQDALDNCPLDGNTDQLDTDNDIVGDVCDTDDDNDGLLDTLELTIGTNTLLIDSDGDSISDFDELNYGGDAYVYTPGIDLNPLLADSDMDGFDDDIEIGAGSNPLDILNTPADGDINNDGSVNVIDILLSTQIALGLKTPTADEMLHGDVAPLIAGVPAPDGEFNTADLLVIQRKVFDQVSF